MWGGVDLFFVLSGFLITGILLRTRTSANYFTSFYARRMLRIFPIYYLALTMSVVAARFSTVVSAALPSTFVWRFSYFIYLQNWPIFWHGEKVMSGLWGAYWSLAVEEQFYFVWPLVLLIASPKMVFRICFVGVPCALLLRYYLYYSYFGNEFGLLQITSSRVDGLLLGSICALYTFLRGRPLPMRSIVACGAVGICIIAYITTFQTHELVATGFWMGTIGVSGFALTSMALVALSQHNISYLQSILTMNWLRQAGKYSYGMYVYHIIIILMLRRSLVSPLTTGLGLGIRFGLPVKLLTMAAEVIVVFLFAKLSYDLFESRFLRLKRYFNPT